MKKLLIVLLLFTLGATLRLNAQQEDAYLRSERLGIAHISSATELVSDLRYQQALQLGAGWNRWPIYWNFVESTPGEWDWERYDLQVTRDLNYRFNINAILIGIPQGYIDGNRMQGLHTPIYADGTDIPEEDKELNPDNHWVHFVQAAVQRYKPGGTLAQSGGIPEGSGIQVWEIWNEPDFAPFWKGSIGDYARLLKISYIVIKQADPNAQVMFGGLLYPTENNWLAQVLGIFINDPLREQFNWYMDIVAVHNYGDPWRSGWLTLYVRQSLLAYGLERPIWLNETGVPVWDDYPGPTWEPESEKRATKEQQAWFFIQSATFAWSEGAEKVFYHQLYDDCGDQPAGTNFRPNNGSTCRTDDDICAGDAFGMYRNLSTSICFSYHPEPGSPRPITRAYRLIASVFGSESFENGTRVYQDRRFTTLTFDRPRSNERITVMWNRTDEPALLEWQAVGQNGQLISLDSSAVIEADENGVYSIGLPPALEDVDESSDPFGGPAIGGSPYILIEQKEGRVQPLLVNLDVLGTQAPQAVETITQNPTAAPIDPANDTQPPIAYIIDLPEVSPPTFTVEWRGVDNSGIDRYLVWVRVDGGTWLPWLETPLTRSDYTGVVGKTYEFSVWAVDLAGNWNEGTEILPQAITRVE